MWVGAIALIIFVFVIHKSVSTLKTTVQGHTSALDKPVIVAEVFPGVPAAFAERWSTATQGTGLTSQDHLWLTLYLTNSGQSQVRGITANLALLPAISAIYPDSGTLVGNPVVVAEGTGQTRMTFSFLSLAPGNAHTVFIALRPDDLTGPPYEVPVQYQWVAQHRAYWVQFTVTVEEHTTFVQYGFAPSLFNRQAASSPAGANAPPGAQRRAAYSATWARYIRPIIPGKPMGLASANSAVSPLVEQHEIVTQRVGQYVADSRRSKPVIATH